MVYSLRTVRTVPLEYLLRLMVLLVFMQGGSRGLTTGWIVLQLAWTVPTSCQPSWTACWQPSRRGLPLKPPVLSNDWLWRCVWMCSRMSRPDMRLVSFCFMCTVQNSAC